MSQALIDRVIQSVVESHSPSSGNNLLGFEFDAEHYFGYNEIFADTKVVPYDNPLCMFELRGQISEQVPSIQHLQSRLVEIWQILAYKYFQATSIEFFKETVVVHFVTVISSERFYVTGKMVVGGRHYLRLVEQYEKDFGVTLVSSPPNFDLDSLWT